MVVPTYVWPLAQIVVSGLLLGFVYASMAIGLTIIFGVMRIFNIAHGVISLFATYLAYSLFTSYGIDPIISIFLTLPIMVAVGIGIQRFLLKPTSTAPPMTSLLILFGVALVIENGLVFGWGGNYRALTPAYSASSFTVGLIFIPETYLIGAVFSLITVISSAIFLKRTRIGKAIRAVSENRELATLVGIKADNINLIAFCWGIAMTAIGGTMLGLISSFYPSLHYTWLGKLFAITLLGGLGSVYGTLFGALIFGLAESLTGYFVGLQWVDVLAYLLIILFLLYRPKGFFGVIR